MAAVVVVPFSWSWSEWTLVRIFILTVTCGSVAPPLTGNCGNLEQKFDTHLICLSFYRVPTPFFQSQIQEFKVFQHLTAVVNYTQLDSRQWIFLLKSELFSQIAIYYINAIRKRFKHFIQNPRIKIFVSYGCFAWTRERVTDVLHQLMGILIKS